MIIILLKYACKDGCRQALLNEIKDKQIAELSRAEEGNIRYEFSISAEDSNVLYLSEVWQNQEILSIHGQTEHFKQMLELKAKYVEVSEVSKYTGDPM